MKHPRLAALFFALTMALCQASVALALSKDPAAKDTPSIAPCVSWVNPVMPPRAAILCVHGLGLHSGSYKDFGMRLSRRGISCYAIDVRGFGSWMNSEGHEQVDFDGCLQDIKQALQSIRAAHPGLPVFLLGESMGGAIALRAASMYPDLIDGLISSVPAGDRFKQKRTDLKVAFELLKGPNRQFDIGKQIVDQATDNEKLRHDWEDDPLNRMNLSPKELIQFQKFMNENHDIAEKITNVPVLFVQGTKDKLVKPEGTWDLFNEVSSEEKVFLAVPSEHLIFEEQQDKDPRHRDNMVRYVTAWILSHCNEIEAQASETNSPGLSAAIAQVNAGQLQRALPALRNAVQQDPQNGDAHYWLGVCLMQMKRPMMAKKELMMAMRLGHGAGHAKEANNFLLSMNGADSASSTTAGITDEMLSTARSITKGKPAVLAFSASWCEQCKKIDSVFDEARAKFGKKIQLIRVDVEDHNNDSLVKAFNVGPIPTLVFLTADGKISATQLGEQNFVNFARQAAKLMR